MPALPSWLRAARPVTAPRVPKPRRLSVEHLEDRTVPASFDPTFGAGGAFQVGGDSPEVARRMTRDGDGNLFVTGFFMSTTDFDPGPGVVSMSSQGGRDGYVAKYSPAGQLMWVRGFGSTNDYEEGVSITADAAGNVYVGTNQDIATDFDLGASYPDSRDIGSNGCVAKYNADGSFGWVWQAPPPTTPLAYVVDLSADGAGNVYAAGRDGMVVKVGPQGAQQWRADFPNSKSGTFGAACLTADGTGNVLLAGTQTGKVDGDPGPGKTTLSSTNGSLVVEKLSPTGGFIWARQMPVTSKAGGVSVSDIAVDAAGNVLTTGYFGGTIDFDPGPGSVTLTAPSPEQPFVGKLTAAGNFAWAKQLGPAVRATPQLAVDSAGAVYLAGSFQGAGDFDPGAGTNTLTSTDSYSDGFVLKLDAGGNFGWAVQLAGAGDNIATGLAVGPTGDVFVAGYFTQTADFGSMSLTSAGSGDIFLAKIKQA